MGSGSKFHAIWPTSHRISLERCRNRRILKDLWCHSGPHPATPGPGKAIRGTRWRHAGACGHCTAPLRGSVVKAGTATASIAFFGRVQSRANGQVEACASSFTHPFRHVDASRSFSIIPPKSRCRPGPEHLSPLQSLAPDWEGCATRILPRRDS